MVDQQQQGNKQESTLKVGSLYSIAMRSGRKSHRSKREKRKELIKRLHPSSKDSDPLWAKYPPKNKNAVAAEVQNNKASSGSPLSAKPVPQDPHPSHIDIQSRRDVSSNNKERSPSSARPIPKDPHPSHDMHPRHDASDNKERSPLSARPVPQETRPSHDDIQPDRDASYIKERSPLSAKPVPQDPHPSHIDIQSRRDISSNNKERSPPSARPIPQDPRPSHDMHPRHDSSYNKERSPLSARPVPQEPPPSYDDIQPDRPPLSAPDLHPSPGMHPRHDTSYNEATMEKTMDYGANKVTMSSKFQQTRVLIEEPFSENIPTKKKAQQMGVRWNIPIDDTSPVGPGIKDFVSPVGIKDFAFQSAYDEEDQENQLHRANDHDEYHAANDRDKYHAANESGKARRQFFSDDSVPANSDDSSCGSSNRSSDDEHSDLGASAYSMIMQKQGKPRKAFNNHHNEVTDDEVEPMVKDITVGPTPTHSNLRQRYEHLNAATNNECSKESKPVVTTRASLFDHPFEPLSPSYDSSKNCSELSAERKEKAHNANTQDATAKAKSRPPTPRDYWSAWDPFQAQGSCDFKDQFDPSDASSYTSSAESLSFASWQPEDNDMSFTTLGLKRTPSPLISPRKPKSPRSSFSNAAFSANSSHSSQSEMEMEGSPTRLPPLKEKIASAFRSLRPAHGEEKKTNSIYRYHPSKDTEKETNLNLRPVLPSPSIETDELQSVSTVSTCSKEEEQNVSSGVRKPNAEAVTTMRPSCAKEEETKHVPPILPPPRSADRKETAVTQEPFFVECEGTSKLAAKPSEPATSSQAEVASCHTSSNVASPTFDIKVAFLGSKKAGKSTVLNAFFQEEFAGENGDSVDHFCLSQCKSKGQTMRHIQEADEIVYVGKSGKEVKERFFDLEIETGVLGEMREDARLVFVDVPGIFPNGGHYLDYAESKWADMDCAVVVLDIENENTKENLTIMKFVKHCLRKRKDVPIVILCNKVDDTEDEDLMARVDEIRKEALAVVLGEKSTEKVTNLAFIPVSGKNAFWYRAASRLPFEEFKKLNNKSIVDEIGRDEMGRFRWKRLSRDEQYRAIYDVVTDPDEYKVRLRASNFDILLNTFDHFLGGKKKQDRIIRKQLEVSLKKLSCQPGFCNRLESIYQRSLFLGKATDHLKDTFWCLYLKSYKEAFSKFKKNPMELAAIHGPMNELSQYATGLHERLHNIDSSEAGYDDAMKEKNQDGEKITNFMKEAIRQQCGLVVEKAYQWIQSQRERDDGNTKITTSPKDWSWEEKKKRWRNKSTGETRAGKKDANPALKISSWDDMTPRDWATVIDSIMIMAYNRQFCENFGGSITALKWLDRKGKFADFVVKSKPKEEVKRACSTDEDDDLEIILGGVGECSSEEAMSLQHLTRLPVPDSPSDPMHWGHLIWMFTRHMESKGQERKI